MGIGFLLDRFKKSSASEFIIWNARSYPYSWLLEHFESARADLVSRGVKEGMVASVECDFSPKAVAILLALLDLRCTIVPLTSSVAVRADDFREIAEVEVRILLSPNDELTVIESGRRVEHQLLLEVRQRKHPGLVLFSSGSTGNAKAALHDFSFLLEKFTVPRQSKRILTFLLFDHIGGINTLFYTLSNAGTIVTVTERAPEVICKAIETYRVEVLPTTPTFLNLLLLSEAHKNFDLSSLTLITYGTEVMPEATLNRLRTEFPEKTLQQTYGLSELGIMRSKSKSSSSTWVKIGGEGFETRVRDGLLEIKAKSAMLGYLNAPSPFTTDGWFMTGDAVEVDGEYFRILGRKSELINVGGEKVYPAEVESHLLLMEGVEDVVVRGEKNPISGHMVVARIRLSTGEDPASFRIRMRQFCKDRLAAFKIPQKVIIDEHLLHNSRFKKMRNGV